LTLKKITDMKKSKYLSIILVTLLFVGSCKQEPIIPGPAPSAPATPNPNVPTRGSADFQKFIAIGNSYVAGVQGGALFNDGQNNSLPAIINKQLVSVGASSTFNQPSIKATLGYNLFITPNPGTDNRVLGRLLLQYGANTPSCATGKISPTPQAQKYALGNLEAVPNPSVNPGFLYFPASRTALNNFGVPAITVGQSLITATGNWANPNPAVGFSPFYARWGAPPGPNSTTIIGDAVAAGGTFFMFYLGLDDFFLYAAFGGDPTQAPLNSSGGFSAAYNGAIATLLGSNANLKGVVGNFPNIFVMPHFTAVSYKPIPLDAPTLSAVNAGFVTPYNGALDALVANAGALGISAALVTEIGTRKVSYAAKCDNNILIMDETLTDLGPYLDAMLGAGSPNRLALEPYRQVRQTTSTDIIPLSAGSVIGTLVNSNTSWVSGVTLPLGTTWDAANSKLVFTSCDRYALIPSEITAINAARDAFNATVAATVATYPTRLALADLDGALASLVTNRAAVLNGVTITPNIDPPTGIYSEDGVHPNTRGYAYLSTVFINAINAKFGSTIPITDISLYGATGLPIP
jgi:hypothetical protein